MAITTTLLDRNKPKHKATTSSTNANNANKMKKKKTDGAATTAKPTNEESQPTQDRRQTLKKRISKRIGKLKPSNNNKAKDDSQQEVAKESNMRPLSRGRGGSVDDFDLPQERTGGGRPRSYSIKIHPMDKKMRKKKKVNSGEQNDAEIEALTNTQTRGRASARAPARRSIIVRRSNSLDSSKDRRQKEQDANARKKNKNAGPPPKFIGAPPPMVRGAPPNQKPGVALRRGSRDDIDLPRPEARADGEKLASMNKKKNSKKHSHHHSHKKSSSKPQEERQKNSKPSKVPSGRSVIENDNPRHSTKERSPTTSRKSKVRPNGSTGDNENTGESTDSGHGARRSNKNLARSNSKTGEQENAHSSLDESAAHHADMDGPNTRSSSLSSAGSQLHRTKHEESHRRRRAHENSTVLRDRLRQSLFVHLGALQELQNEFSDEEDSEPAPVTAAENPKTYDRAESDSKLHEHEKRVLRNRRRFAHHSLNQDVEQEPCDDETEFFSCSLEGLNRRADYHTVKPRSEMQQGMIKAPSLTFKLATEDD